MKTTQKQYEIEKVSALDVSQNTEAAIYAAGADAENTKRGYSADWKHFVEWCKARSASSLPARPDDLALYIRSCVEKMSLNVSTVRRRLSAIARAHRMNGFESPTSEWIVKSTIRRLAREHGKPPVKKKALLLADLRKIVASLPPTLTGVRDRAILLLGFAGALRRSDIVGLQVQDLTSAAEGIVAMIRKGKTDKERKGVEIGIPRFDEDPEVCPVRSVIEWLTISKIEEGPLFRKIDRHQNVYQEALNGYSIACIVKKYAPTVGRRRSTLAAHSLRSGFITTAVMKEASELEIQRQTQHRSVAVLRGYVESATVFSHNAARKVFKK